MRTSLVFAILGLTAVLIVACGGGGGGSGAVVENSPSISNLSFSPTIIEIGQLTDIEGTLDFLDNDGDLSTLTIVSADGSQQTTNISGLSGQKSGTIMGIVQLQASELGKSTFQVFVSDAKGHQSNSLSGSITVTPAGVLSTGAINDKIYLRAGSYFVEYDPSTSLWSNKSFTADVQLGIGFGVIASRLYAVGESRTDIYDQLSDQWSSGVPLSSPRYSSSVCTFNNKIYVFGGATRNPLDGLDVPSNVVEQFDPVSNQWTTKSVMPTARSGSVAVAVNNLLYVINGWANGFTSSAVEAYDPATDTWTSKASFGCNGSMSGSTASVVNDKIYWFDANQNVCEYDSLTNTWSAKNQMPAASSNMKSEMINGKIYLIGSMGVYEYDPTSDLWRQVE